jgi:hypothetical protein
MTKMSAEERSPGIIPLINLLSNFAMAGFDMKSELAGW